MADLTQYYDALRNADAAGDTEGAKKIADYIRSQEQPAQEPGLAGVQQAGAAAAKGMLGLPERGEDVRGWLTPGEAKPTGAGEFLGATAGGAATGYAAGRYFPELAKVGGKIPGPAGRTIAALGAAAELLPAKERALRGAFGGGTQELISKTGEAFGAPKALSYGAAVVGGSGAEAAGSFLAKETGQLLQAAGNMARGNVSGMMYALKGVLQPTKELNAESAKALQRQLFGDKIPGYIDNLIGSENRAATQAALRAADPSLKVRTMAEAAPEGVATPVPGSGFGMSTSRDVTAPRSVMGEDHMLGGPRALPAPGDMLRTKEGMTAEQIKAALKAKAAGKEAAATAQRDWDVKPASEIYRERMFSGVTQAVNRGEAFSASPAFEQFKRDLGVQIELGNVSAKEAQKLLGDLMADRSKNPAVRDAYAKNVDDRIRQWGKPLEAGGATGAAVIDQEVAAGVRGNLQKAYNSYLEGLGMGKLESQYRNAYRQEMVAEAKDKLPSFLYGFEKPAEFQRFVRTMKGEPGGTEFIQKSLRQHLAQAELAALPKEFDRLQKILVQSDLITPAQLSKLRESVAGVEVMRERGAHLQGLKRFQQLLLMATAQAGGGAAGARVGEAATRD